jgi:hypothetical protein
MTQQQEAQGGPGRLAASYSCCLLRGLHLLCCCCCADHPVLGCHEVKHAAAAKLSACSRGRVYCCCWQPPACRCKKACCRSRTRVLHGCAVSGGWQLPEAPAHIRHPGTRTNSVSTLTSLFPLACCTVGCIACVYRHQHRHARTQHIQSCLSFSKWPGPHRLTTQNLVQLPRLPAAGGTCNQCSYGNLLLTECYCRLNVTADDPFACIAQCPALQCSRVASMLLQAHDLQPLSCPGLWHNHTAYSVM